MPKTITIKLDKGNETAQKFYEAVEKRDRNIFSSQTKYIMYCVLLVANTPDEKGSMGKELRKNRNLLKEIMKEALEEFETERAAY